MLKAGDIFGGTYKLEEMLGKGGWGEVWKAEHVLLREPRAIKVMLSELAGDPEIRARFIEGEARNALRLDRHPNIVRVYELGLHENMPFMVLEYVRGGPEGVTLKHLMHTYGKFTVQEAWQVVSQVSAGLEVAHKIGLVHRDIKPGNILVAEDGTAKLSDFGLTKDTHHDQNLTEVGYTVGTFTYIAPEQAAGFPQTRSDIYSLGVVMYELLTGRLPFSGNSAALILQHAKQPPPDPRLLEPSIPDEIATVILRAIAKRPDERFASARDFAAAYAAAMRGENPSGLSDDLTIAHPINDRSPSAAFPKWLFEESKDHTIIEPVGEVTGKKPILPDGTVTFLFTDIEGSTKLWEDKPEAMKVALTKHDEIMRRAIGDNYGFVFKTVGDAFYAVFTTTADALGAAISAQRLLHAENWGETGEIKVRMSIHVGTAELRDNDYFGQSLNRVARILAAGHGGQILVSGAAYEILRGRENEQIKFRDMGKHRLKDLSQAEPIYQADITNLPQDFPPLKSLDNHPTNLPAQGSPLIGREREVKEVIELLGRNSVRLVTLVGPGGTGKTRLSLQVGAEMLESFADGVYFIELEHIAEPNIALATIAHTLSVKETDKPLMTELKAFLQKKQMLLILDNFEQIVSAGKLIDELLKNAPKVKALASSRIALRIYGEQEYAVPPLALPNPKRLPPLDELEKYAAVALFVERAQSVKRDFKLSIENAQAVVDICTQLDGLPLAIELAASRIKLLPPQALLTRLTNKLKMLTGGAANLPTRQRTLRGAIDWSFDLLDANEKRLFARLGVFNQGWNFAAAETVAGEGLDIDILDGMGSLIDKSLMRQFERENGEPRFTMLETIREYALEKLDESGEGEEVRVKHARYYRLFAEEADNDLRQANQVLWLKQLDLEQGNFKAAITWLIENPNTEKLEIALGLAGTLWRFWAQRGYVSEGLHLIVQVLAKSKNDEKLSGSRAKAANGAGNLAWVQGDYTQALSMLEDSLQLRRQQGNEDEVASALQNMGNLALEQGDHAKAGANYRECLELRRKLGVKSDIAIALQNLGNLTLELEELTEAKDYFTEALSLYRDMGDKRGAEAAQSRLRLINSRL